MEQNSLEKIVGSQTTLSEQEVQAIQAQFNSGNSVPLFKTIYKEDIVYTCQNAVKDRCGFMFWFRKEDSKLEPKTYTVLVDICQHDGNCQLVPSEIGHSPEGSQKELAPSAPEQTDQPMQKLYSENEISLLKKELEFQSKGLLSKSTDIDHQQNLVTTIRFKCKNFPYANVCPFLHTLDYKCHIDGKPHYAHKVINNEHLPECIMDDQNMQYNVTARKIDAAMNILEQIVMLNPDIKPKLILHMFGERLGEESQQFLYEGLKQKNIKRSIKKYFDNAVAKAKNKLKQR